MKTTRKYCACHTKRRSTLLQTRQNVTKSATPATQNDIRTCLETFENERFCSFPHRQRHKKTKELRRDMLEPQNERFVRDFLKFSHFVATKSTFSHEFSYELQNLRPQTRCFVQSFRRFSSYVTKCHACHAICTLSPLDAALTMRSDAFRKRHSTTRLKCCACHANDDGGHHPSAIPATKNAIHLFKTTQKYCACHARRLSTRYETCWSVTKCHACHAKRSYVTFETSKRDRFCRTRRGRGHRAFTRTVANRCERLRNV